MSFSKLSILLGAIGLTVSLIGCTTTTTPLSKNQLMTNSMNHLTDSTPRLAIIAAFGQEADLLIESTKDKKEYIINGRKFVTGTLEGAEVVITLSGISMTNAAMTTQMIR